MDYKLTKELRRTVFLLIGKFARFHRSNQKNEKAVVDEFWDKLQ
jgi:hypothetical protein